MVLEAGKAPSRSAEEAVWSAVSGLQRGGRPRLLGLAGPQGAGKSTLTGALQARARAAGLRLLALSLDDYYLSRRERARLALRVHPLFATRGPPGTHDLAALEETLAAAAAGLPTPIWRFDKGADERAPEAEWDRAEGDWDVVLLEGWCVGAAPEPAERLVRPVNALEALEDAAGVWRGAVNTALAGPYARLWARLDGFVLLTAPDFPTVLRWRTQQEADRPIAQRMSGEALARFTQHFERLTIWMAQEAPARARMHLALDPQRQAITGSAARGSTPPVNSAPPS